MTDKNSGTGRDGRGRFAKGHSANPKGRPKKKAEPAASPVDVFLDKSVTMKTADGATKRVSVADASLHATLQEAFKGKAAAITRITNCMIKRAKWRARKSDDAARKLRAKTSSTKFESDQGNANDALLLLGIATRDEEYENAVGTPGYRHLKLETWIIQKALGRRRSSGPMDKRDVLEIERCARAPEDIRWPEGARE